MKIIRDKKGNLYLLRDRKHQDRSKYMPHQGKKECARRIK